VKDVVQGFLKVPCVVGERRVSQDHGLLLVADIFYLAGAERAPDIVRIMFNVLSIGTLQLALDFN
jgi:hypothetical protein